jgi:hypothetical protein
MPLLPFKRYELQSDRTPGELVAAIDAAVEPRRFLRFTKAKCPFEGEVSDREFNVQRTIGYRNSFLPQISGTIDPDPQGSRIAITMSLHPLVLGFLVFWLGLVLMMLVLFLLPSHRVGSAHWAALVPAGMFVFGWALSAGAFTYEVSRAEPLLARILMARPSDIAAGDVAPRGA